MKTDVNIDIQSAHAIILDLDEDFLQIWEKFCYFTEEDRSWFCHDCLDRF